MIGGHSIQITTSDISSHSKIKIGMTSSTVSPGIWKYLHR
jgi:hypothetical protein